MIGVDEELFCRINRQMISQFGGLYVDAARNVRDQNALSYLVADQQNELSLDGELREIAATLAYRVITRHVFVDGCKRTAMQAAFLLLQLNSYDVFASNEEIVGIARAVGDGSIDQQALIDWFKTMTAPSPPLAFSSAPPLRTYA